MKNFQKIALDRIRILFNLAKDNSLNHPERSNRYVKSAKKIVDTVLRYGSDVIGPVPLPTDIDKFTVNSSTFVHEDAKNQYEMRVHKRLIDILETNPKVIDALMNLNLPSGVDVEIKMM